MCRWTHSGSGYIQLFCRNDDSYTVGKFQLGKCWKYHANLECYPVGIRQTVGGVPMVLPVFSTLSAHQHLPRAPSISRELLTATMLLVATPFVVISSLLIMIGGTYRKRPKRQALRSLLLLVPSALPRYQNITCDSFETDRYHASLL